MIIHAGLALALCASTPVCAASVDVNITSTDGHPTASAVVELFPADNGAAILPSHLSDEAIIDQRDETFIPLVSLIRRGGHVVFTNNDHTMHQVYSFSPIKQFAFEVDRGQKSAPVLFDKPGIAAIGCNIHDQMITYVYVAETPWAAAADANGHIQITQVPPGKYRVSIWDPKLKPGYHPETISLNVTRDGAKLSLSIPLLAGDPRNMKHTHLQSY
jgi:plastocyanin